MESDKTLSSASSSSQGFFSHNMTQNELVSMPTQRNTEISQGTSFPIASEAHGSGLYEYQTPRNKPRPKTSEYIGVSKQGNRAEAFVWESTKKQGERGKTVYLGGFKDEVAAARARDLFAIKMRGKSITTNFPVNCYQKELEEMKYMNLDECVLALRRKSKKKSFAKGLSHYRGVTRNSLQSKWQVRLGKSRGTRSIYLGSFDTEEEAARAYDIASIRLRGVGAITNFDVNQYDIQSILKSPKIPIGKGASKLIRTYTVKDLLFVRAKQLPNITANNPPSESHHNNDISNEILVAPIMNTDIGNIAVTAGPDESSGDPKPSFQAAPISDGGDPSASFQGTSSIFEGDLMPLFEGVSIFDGIGNPMASFEAAPALDGGEFGDLTPSFQGAPVFDGDPTASSGGAQIFEGEATASFQGGGGALFESEASASFEGAQAQIHFEDDTERMWREVYGESLMDHMLSETENSQLSYFGEAGTSTATTAPDWTVGMDLDFPGEFTADDLDLLNSTEEFGFNGDNNIPPPSES